MSWSGFIKNKKNQKQLLKKDRQIDKQIDRQTDRQTERVTERDIFTQYKSIYYYRSWSGFIQEFRNAT